MNMSCSSRMIKYLMFAFNLLFVISGIILIAVGATVKTVYSDYADFLDTKYFSLPNMLIATGALIFFISFFGCCGAIKESWIMLGVFSILLCIIFIFEFSAGIAGYVLRDKTISYLETTLTENLKNYPNKTNSIWDSIQSGFQCCGVHSYKDWSNVFPDHPNALPISCCPAVKGSIGVFYCNTNFGPTTGTTPSSSITTNPSPTTPPTTIPPTTIAPTTIPSSTDSPASSPATKSTINPTTPEKTTEVPTTTVATETPISPKEPETRRKRAANKISDSNPNADTGSTTVTPISPSTSEPYNTGCAESFGRYIKKHAVQIGGCAMALAVIQILGIVFSCHLVRQMKNGYYST